MVSANGTDQLLAGDVAKLLGVGVQTLHFYEREGLIPQMPRSPAATGLIRTWSSSACGSGTRLGPVRQQNPHEMLGGRRTEHRVFRGELAPTLLTPCSSAFFPSWTSWVRVPSPALCFNNYNAAGIDDSGGVAVSARAGAAVRPETLPRDDHTPLRSDGTLRRKCGGARGERRAADTPRRTRDTLRHMRRPARAGGRRPVQSVASRPVSWPHR